MTESRNSSINSSMTKVPNSPLFSKATIEDRNIQTPSPDEVDLEKMVLSAGDYPGTLKEELQEVVTEAGDPFCIEFNDDDSDSPRGWKFVYRFQLSILASALCFCATFASSLPSGAFLQIQNEFGASDIETTLATSLFVAGYIIGPIFWGPLSEMYGRRKVFLITFTGFSIFTLPCALAQNMTTILISRFISGTFAASALTNSGAVIADMFAPKDRGIPFAAFSTVPTVGPLLAPLCSSFLATKYGFRPIFWLQFTFAALLLLVIYFVLPETYHPVLLQRKAILRREQTGDDRYWARLEREDFSLKAIITKTIARPIIMLFTEPIVILMSAYLSLIYGVIYLSFELYPAIFQDIHGFSSGIASLPFLAVALGVVLGYACVPYFEKGYRRKFEENGNQACPEERMIGLFGGAPLFTIGLFWLGWTSNVNIHYIVPTLAGIPLGIGIFACFQCTLNYLADTYQMYSASAFSAAQVARALTGFALPLAATPAISKVGVAFTTTILGTAALIMCPMPFIFYRYGKKIRSYSKLAF